MWLSKALNQTVPVPRPEAARITMDSQGGEATGSIQSRAFASYGPLGYQAALPQGSDVLMVPALSGSAAVGVANEVTGLAAGEIRIRSDSGAYVFLRRDGSVEINGLVIRPGGEIVQKTGET